MPPVAPDSNPQSQQQALASGKQNAEICLIIAGGAFACSFLLPSHFLVSLLRHASEAAMVGGLADWFAVTALFRTVPIPFLSRHSNVIPANKDRIADQLASFVKDRFFGHDSIKELLRQHQPVRLLADWLAQERNAKQFSAYALRFTNEALNTLSDAPIREALQTGVKSALKKLDLNASALSLLKGLTRNGQHQALLNETLSFLKRQLADEQRAAQASTAIAGWVQAEYPTLEKLVPASLYAFLGKKSVEAGDGFLNRVLKSPDHELRAYVDEQLQSLLTRMRSDADFAEQVEQFKQRLLAHEELNAYLSQLWGQLISRLREDLNDSNSYIGKKVSALAQSFGHKLLQDPELLAALDRHLEQAAEQMSPELAEFLARHIRNTVRSWDAQAMGEQLELSVGAQLQGIRISGTLVGGLIGAGLFLIGQVFLLLREQPF